MTSRCLLCALWALLALPAAAGEPPAGGGGADPGVRGEILACRLAVLGRAVELRQTFKDGTFAGSFRVTVRAERVLKGTLGPVMALSVTLAAAETEAHAALLNGVACPEAPPVVLLLDEGDRMQCPPRFRILGLPRPASAAEEADAVVRAEIGRQAARLLSEEETEREAASGALAALGTPALAELQALQKTAPAPAAEWARKTLLSIRDSQTDPCRMVQANPRAPFTPVDVLGAPDSRETLFRLAPGALVFRFETWTHPTGSWVRIRTPDGREGWVAAEACAPVALCAE